MPDKTQRNYRDRLFIRIFSQKEMALSLYNAVNGTNYQNAEGLEINTIEDVIYVTMYNDVSFIFEGCLSLYEHQSTFNPNMPLRGFLYFARLYQPYAEGSRIFSARIMEIPSPRFVVFYNGAKDTPDCVKLKLSDMFRVKIPAGEFEWTATMLNINYGRNKDLMSRCRDLRDYSLYVKLVDDYKKKYPGSRKKAVTAAVDEAIRLGLLGGYFKRRREEAILDVLTEFDEESYRRVVFEDGFADGKAEQWAADKAALEQKDAEIARLAARIAELEGGRF